MRYHAAASGSAEWIWRHVATGSGRRHRRGRHGATSIPSRITLHTHAQIFFVLQASCSSCLKVPGPVFDHSISVAHSVYKANFVGSEFYFSEKEEGLQPSFQPVFIRAAPPRTLNSPVRPEEISV